VEIRLWSAATADGDSSLRCRRPVTHSSALVTTSPDRGDMRLRAWDSAARAATLYATEPDDPRPTQQDQSARPGSLHRSNLSHLGIHI
jgi:hypothetical protein